MQTNLEKHFIRHLKPFADSWNIKMTELFPQPNFYIAGKVAVVTGGAGVLCAAMCRALANAGAKIAVLDLNPAAAGRLAAEICYCGR